MTDHDKELKEQVDDIFNGYNGFLDHEYQGVAYDKEDAINAIMHLITTDRERAVREAKAVLLDSFKQLEEDELQLRKFIAALVWQSGGVVTVTARTLRDIPAKVDFEILNNVDRSVTVAIPQDKYIATLTKEAGEQV